MVASFDHFDLKIRQKQGLNLYHEFGMQFHRRNFRGFHKHSIELYHKTK